MNSRYLCAYHQERLRVCESGAYRFWAEMMRRGAMTYTECRFDAAIIYLGTALDIGLLRQGCEQNGLFSAFHLLKPAEFLYEALLLEQRFGEAEALLRKISSATDHCNDGFAAQLRSFLAQAYERVEQAGKHQLMHAPRETREVHQVH